MIIINFKNYVLGEKALNLAKKISKVNKKVIIAVSAVDIEEIAKLTKLKVYAEHVDYVEGKKTTGYVIPESIKAVKGKGMLINHSEHKLTLKEIKQTVNRCKKLKLETVVCSSNMKQIKEIKKLKPKAIAYEDPKLISTGKSITKHNPKQIQEFANLLKNTKILPLCGAGISTKEDIKEAKKLGCKGVLIASAITKKGNVGMLK